MNKNRFLTFLFSLIPGCGLMYLGYMKKGLQVMSMVTAAGFAAYFFSSFWIDWFSALFILLIPIIWLYQMFDAMHTVARMKNQGIELPGDDGFVMPDGIVRFSPMQNRTATKIIAGILIVVGVLSLIMGAANNLWQWNINQEVVRIINDAVRNGLIPAVVSIALIIAGVKLLKGGKKKKADDGYEEEGDLP